MFAFHFNGTVVEKHDALGERQPQSIALCGMRRIRLIEPVEDVGKNLLTHADAAVGDYHLDGSLLLCQPNAD